MLFLGQLDLPSFVTEKDSEFVTAMFSYPFMVCNVQKLHSVIVKPTGGDKTPRRDVEKGK